MASSHHRSRHSMSSSSSSSSSSPPSGKDLNDAEFRERVLFALRRQIRPAEEVDAVRRLMATNLAQSLGKDQLTNPLALVDADTVVPSTPPPSSDDLSPLQREFVEAVRTNVELRADFAKMQEDHRKEEAAAAAAATTEEQRRREEEEEEEEEEIEADEAKLLRLQLRCASLQEKVDRYSLAIKHMESLKRQPAAAPDFLDPQVMFRDCDPLPEMPRELMDSFTFDRGASQARTRDLFQRIKKENLRQTIVTQQQERRVAEALARDPVDPSTVPPEVQVRALNAVKNHLIGWIETHLSKAGGDEGEDDEPSFIADSPEKKREPRKTEKDGDDNEEYDYEAQLAEIQKEYDRHIDLRKEVLTLISYHEKMTSEWSQILKKEQEKQNQNKNKDEPSPKDEPAPPTRTTTNASLITPYIEKLQAIARKQKGLAQEKSHINTTLARHQQETREMIGHLAEESQLLARFPGAGKPEPAPSSSSSSSSSSADFGEVTKGAAAAAAAAATKQQQQASLVSQLEPWLLAADAAKLATLETVAEKVEEGQMAVDEAMAALDEARKVLDREEEGEGEEDGDGDGDGEEEASREQQQQKAPAASGVTATENKGKNIYAKLDGNLGLINE